MKRLLTVTVVMVLLLISFSGCVNESSTPSSTVNTTLSSAQTSNSDKRIIDYSSWGSISNYMTYENNEYILTLPNSLSTLDISDYIQYFEKVEVEVLKTAESRILEKTKEYDQKSDFYLQKDQEGCLCLFVEVIVPLEPPTINGITMGGCGYDHDHLFFKEVLIDISK